MRDEDGVTHQIDRNHILKVMDDDGKVVYTAPSLAQDAALPPPLPSAAAAPPPSQQHDEGFEQHDGFFLRMLGGWGAYSFEGTNIYNDKLTFSSLMGVFHLQLGFAVVDNFILYGSLSGYSSMDITKAEVNGQTQYMSNSMKAGISGMSAGFTYYIMPLNLYIGADIGRAVTILTSGSASLESKAGFGFNLYIGKEWWVSKNWGIGATLFYHYSSLPDGTPDSMIAHTNTVIGIAFSATYN